MNYDLSDKNWRRKFVKRANQLLRLKRTNVSLVDESNRTLNQNSYVHVLFRIVADYTGDSEEYVKQVHFKMLVNPDIFIAVTKDRITGRMTRYVRSSAEVSVSEMARAIANFILWAAEHGIRLPEARPDKDGTMTFASEQDKEAFHQAQLLTSKG